MPSPACSRPAPKYIEKKRQDNGYAALSMQSTVDLTDTWCCGATPLLFSVVNKPAETLAKLDRDYPSLAKMAADGGAYDPPQLNPAQTFVSCCLGLPWPDSCNLGTVNWFSHRSPLCALCPAAVCLGYMKCCFGFTELSLLESGDEVFIEMLQRGVAPEQCPERLKGLYWMQDNLANEVLVTWQDAYWQPATATAPFLGTKDLGLNFTRDPTCFGVWNTRGPSGQNPGIWKRPGPPLFVVEVSSRQSIRVSLHVDGLT